MLKSLVILLLIFVFNCKENESKGDISEIKIRNVSFTPISKVIIFDKFSINLPESFQKKDYTSSNGELEKAQFVGDCNKHEPCLTEEITFYLYKKDKKEIDDIITNSSGSEILTPFHRVSELENIKDLQALNSKVIYGKLPVGGNIFIGLYEFDSYILKINLKMIYVQKFSNKELEKLLEENIKILNSLGKKEIEL